MPSGRGPVGFSLLAATPTPREKSRWLCSDVYSGTTAAESAAALAGFMCAKYCSTYPLEPSGIVVMKWSSVDTKRRRPNRLAAHIANRQRKFPRRPDPPIVQPPLYVAPLSSASSRHVRHCRVCLASRWFNLYPQSPADVRFAGRRRKHYSPLWSCAVNP